MVDSTSLLNDEQMRAFLSNGFVKIETQLPKEFHQRIYEQTEEAFEKDGNPGNNILPRVPELGKVFSDPSVVGGLTSVLGPDYVMHVHRHPHVNRGPNEGGGWHKDSYWGFKKIRSHRTRWAMIFYYPQDTPLDNGPTGVIPGTHCLESRCENEKDEKHLPITGEAGTCALVHFDLWHRAYPNTIDKMRYMMKFQFTRMSEPVGPVWNCSDRSWRGSTDQFLWARHWDWHVGGGSLTPRSNLSVDSLCTDLGDEDDSIRLRAISGLGFLGESSVKTIDVLAESLSDTNEVLRTNAAYVLGAMGSPAVSVLSDRLSDESEEVRLVAAHGLAQMGSAAVPILLEGLKSPDALRRAHCAFSLGDMGKLSGTGTGVALAKLITDESELVRFTVAEALGFVLYESEQVVSALCSLLKDESGQVRYEAAYGLARIGSKAGSAVKALTEALYDEDNRYVSGHSATALQRIQSPEANESLINYLSSSRWCSMTNKESTF